MVFTNNPVINKYTSIELNFHGYSQNSQPTVHIVGFLLLTDMSAIVLYRTKFGENVKNQFGKIKFGENIKILIIAVKMQNTWQIKFGDLAKLANFSLTKPLSYMVSYGHAKGFSTRKYTIQQ